MQKKSFTAFALRTESQPTYKTSKILKISKEEATKHNVFLHLDKINNILNYYLKKGRRPSKCYIEAETPSFFYKQVLAPRWGEWDV